jgi:tetratricopeptide (TPR) repeat protein
MQLKHLSFLLFILFSSLLFAQKSEELIKEGDKLKDSFNDQGALDKYFKADKLAPNNWEIMWRISRSYVDLGAHMPESTSEQKDQQLEVFQKGLYYGEQAVKYGPNQSITYIRRAIANGRIALFKGVFSVGSVVNSVKSDCEKAIQLNNGGNYTQALAHYVFARTHAKISEKWAPARAVLGLGWADNEIALKEYQKAVTIFPNYRMFYLDYARSLAREDKYSEAKNMLNKCISSPQQEEDDVSRLAEAKQLLNEIRNK